MGRKRRQTGDGLPGGVSPEELHDLFEPPSDEDLQAANTTLIGLSEHEAAEYRAVAERRVAAVGGLPSVRLYPIEHEDAFARFVSLVPSSPGSAWIVSGYLAWTNGGDHMAIRQLTVEPAPHSEATTITSTVLRAIAQAAGQILAKSRASLATEPEWLTALERAGLAAPTAEEKKQALAAAEAAARAPLRRGRTGYPVDHYRRIAALYLDLQKQGIGRGILREIAEVETRRLGRNVARATVRDWVHKARDLGFLTPGKPGRAGAQEGPNFYKLDEEER